MTDFRSNLLEESNFRFAALFEQAPFSLHLLSSDGRTLQVNKAWEAMWQVCEGDGLKEYVLTEYNVFSASQLAAKGIRNIFVGRSRVNRFQFQQFFTILQSWVGRDELAG